MTTAGRGTLHRIWIVCLLVFLVALGIRLAYLYQLLHTPFANELGVLVDARYYDMRAREIASGDLLGDAPGFLSPLYCYFLGLVYAFAGPGLALAKGVQVVLGALSCVLMYLIGRQLFSEVVGILAATMLASYGTHVYYHGLLLPATLIVFLHLLLILVLIGGATRLRFVLAGLLIGLAVLAKANALLLLPAIAAALWFSRPDLARNRRVTLILVMSAAAFAAIAPVTIGNYLRSDRFVLVTTSGGSNLLKGNGPTATGSHAFLPLGTQATGVPAHLDHQVDGTEAVDQSRALSAQARAYMLSHPVRTALLFSKKFLLFFNATELTIRDQYYFATTRMHLLRLPLVSFWGVALLGLAGMGFSWRDRKRLAVLYAVLAAQVLSFVLIFVLARYRLVAAACLILFAARQLVLFAEWFAAGVWRNLAWGVGAAGTLALVVFLPFAEFPRDKGFADQYKFLGESYYEASDYERAAEAYAGAMASRWVDPRSAQLKRWECLLGLGRSQIGLGQEAEGRRTLHRLLAEIEGRIPGTSTETEREARRLLERLGA